MTDNSSYPEVSNAPEFPKIEEAVLSFWQEQGIFQCSIDQHPAEKDGKDNAFVFYDGPPFANGLPHYGHLLTGYVKDIFARYHTQQGKRVERRFGWDCHGLPAEMGAEKELGVSGRMQIQAFGIEKFNDHCRNSVMKYTQEWEHYVTRQARWVDFHNDYKTMDTDFMESVMWAFKQLFDKGLVYESMRVMPYSWACETPLSNFETRLDNSYREKTSKAVTVTFTLKNTPEPLVNKEYNNYKLLAWTTTAWTLPSNLALAVGKDITYVSIAHEGECYILAKSSLAHYSKEFGLDKEHLAEAIIAEYTGEALIGLEYTPLFDYFADNPHSFKVLAADFVEEGDGTGIVHIAPGFGEDDFELCNAHDIPLVCPVDSAGKFTAEVPEFATMQVFEANDEIIKMLKQHNAWIKTEQYLHNYPHCWRTDTPLIYKAVPSWYVEVSRFKDRMVELNQQINWTPHHVKDGLFGKWLENARDWSISRNRFWGAPIPVWRSDNPKNKTLYVYGSIAELEKDFGVTITDLHKPFIDELTRPDPEDANYTLRRVPDVFDCWFESGSMPYAQVHYPFENQEWFEAHSPADFIVEYTAQTRGWFYTLMVLSTALFDRPPFLNCICHGVVLDENGQKLSKRLNNYADPMELFNSYGADALRWLMVSSPILRGGELLIDKEGNMVRDVLRLSIKPIWNAYYFFTLYANSDGITAHYITDSDNVIDRYILAKCRNMVAAVKEAMDHYNTPEATTAIEAFVEVLNNWYIRRNRDRYWRKFSADDSDKQAAYDTLYTVLHLLCRTAAPLLPLISEAIYQGLEKDNTVSVHLTSFPEVSTLPLDETLTKNMDKVRDACNAALSIRNTQNIRIRQPLATLTIVAKGASNLNDYEHLIQDEVNVKSVAFVEEVDAFASFKLQVNFKVAGKRLGAKMKMVAAAAKNGEWKSLSAENIEVAGEILQPDEYTILLEAKDPNASQALSTNDALVVLDLAINDALKMEGIARDLIRLIQEQRKRADLDISDHIVLTIGCDDGIIRETLTTHHRYICEQTLAIDIHITEAVTSTDTTHDVNGASVSIHVTRSTDSSDISQSVTR